MKNKDILELYHSLSAIKGLKGVKFNYAIAKNVSLLEIEVKSFEKALEASEQFKEYDQARIELCKEHSEKDENGEAIMTDGNFKIADSKAFKEAYEVLKEKHAEAIEARKTQQTEFDELMEKENSITLFKVKMSDIPEEITTENMKSIYQLIED